MNPVYGKTIKRGGFWLEGCDSKLFNCYTFDIGTLIKKEKTTYFQGTGNLFYQDRWIPLTIKTTVSKNGNVIHAYQTKKNTLAGIKGSITFGKDPFKLNNLSIILNGKSVKINKKSIIIRSVGTGIDIKEAKLTAYKELWSGTWSTQSQEGTISFTLRGIDGLMEGYTTHENQIGTWDGTILSSGLIIANYRYPNFSAQAIGGIWGLQKNKVFGYLRFYEDFINDQTPFDVATFEFTRTDISPKKNTTPVSSKNPYIGNGIYIPCVAKSICGQIGGNALTGNWSWTSGLFNDIKTNYPQIWCNQYPGSC